MIQAVAGLLVPLVHLGLLYFELSVLPGLMMAMSRFDLNSIEFEPLRDVEFGERDVK